MCLISKVPFFVLIFFLLFFLASDCLPAADPYKILCERNSLYQYFTVIESVIKGERYLVAKKRGFRQGGILIDAPEKLLLDYTKTAFVGLAFLNKDPQRALFIGLGVGAMPRFFRKHYPNSQMEIVELDPEILDVAREYFFFPQDQNIPVHIADGRAFLKRTSEKYDIVFIDAYRENYIPFHLTTIEFLREVRKNLSEEGVVVSNISIPPWTKLFHSFLKTYSEAFHHLSVFISKGSGNFIFVTVLDENRGIQKDVLKRAGEIDLSKKWDISLSERAEYKMDLSDERVEKGKLLTDDFAPVNIYRLQKQ